MNILLRLMKHTPAPRLAFHVSQALMRLRRPLTLGARMVVWDEQGRVCLIRHTYRPGWHFPGGGVKRWETMEQAAVREAREEAGVAVDEVARMIGLYANFRPERSDHVALYEAASWHRVDFQSFEIAEVGFFPPDGLPADTSPATLRRLAEIRENRPPAVHW